MEYRERKRQPRKPGSLPTPGDKDPGSGWSRDTLKSGVFLISDLHVNREGW